MSFTVDSTCVPGGIMSGCRHIFLGQRDDCHRWKLGWIGGSKDTIDVSRATRAFPQDFGNAEIVGKQMYEKSVDYKSKTS